MSDPKERGVRDDGFEFWGVITASLSHEINNVFAIINELSGLLDDIFHAADPGKPMDIGKLQSATRRISEQVTRGQIHVRQLNRFAHTVDHQRITMDLNEEVAAVAALCGRFATLRRIGLETRLPEASPRLEGRAFDVQHVAFRCIDIAFDASGPGDVVEVAVEPRGDGARLVVGNRSALVSAPTLEDKLAALAVLAGAINGTVETTFAEGQPLRLAVSLPRSLDAAGNDHD